MSFRFSTNRYVSPAASSAPQALYYFYAFMTALPPNGPGWVSVGESDGAAGGMGVTGLILSPTSLDPANAWFVLESPDGARQILFHRDVGGVAAAAEAHYLYNRAADYVGGSAVALPTSPSGLAREVYTSTGFFFSGFFQYLADDQYPYAWVFFGFSGNSGRGTALYGPITSPMTDDVDPVVVAGSDTSVDWATISTAIASPTAKTWSPQGSVWGGVAGLSYNNGGSTISPSNTPFGTNNTNQPLPICFSTMASSSPAFFKGFSNFLRWGSGPVTGKGTFASRKYIIYDTLVFPWDGVTDPL
jgi:hypothetical protein